MKDEAEDDEGNRDSDSDFHSDGKLSDEAELTSESNDKTNCSATKKKEKRAAKPGLARLKTFIKDWEA